MFEFIKEFWEFLRERKKYWLLPIIIVLALFGILIDINFTIEQIAIVSGAYILMSIILLYLVKNKLNPEYL